MEGRSTSLEPTMTTPKKRKRSSHSPSPDSPSADGDTTFEANNGVLSGHASPVDHDTSHLDGHKRTKLQELPRDHGAIPHRQIDIARILSNLRKLPPELWQYVFTFVPPMYLGRLLCVSRSFNTLLDPAQTLAQSTSTGSMPLRNQNQIWTDARKRCLPGLPRPLSGMLEKDLWKLLRGRSCQFCGKKAPKDHSSVGPAPWSSGPGQDGVRVVWPFAVRSCAACLNTRLVKETELIFSSSSFLMPALPFAIFTSSLSYVSSVTLQGTTLPPSLQLIKYYFRPQVDQLRRDLDEAKALGSAAAEEWYKGLERSGKEKLQDSARWEQWEASGGFQSLQSHQLTQSPRHNVHRTNSHHSTSSSYITGGPPSEGHPRTPSHPSGAVQPMTPSSQSVMQGPVLGLPPKPTTPASGYLFNHALQTRAPQPPVPIQPHIPQARAERSIRDINQMKTERKAEIERRCLQLDPPIMPSTLIYMDSFAAAIQIPTALNDNAWELLKPRLLAQRDMAEQREQEQRAANNHLQAKAEERRQQEAQLTEAREIMNREWEEMQKPVREKISSYADELIHADWRDGEAVNEENCPQFAADVLLHVRKRFFEALAQEDAMLIERNLPLRPDSPGGSTRRLTLENLKWAFETRIKPITEHYRKELFLCSVCDNPSKFYALDAVIQHYAAKHTSALSMGTAVVFWKADWPEEPPFDPHPSASRARHRLSLSAAVPHLGGSMPQGHSMGGYSQYSARSQFAAPEQASMYHPSPQMSHSRLSYNYQGNGFLPPSGHQSPPGVESHATHIEHAYGQTSKHFPLPSRRPYELPLNHYQPPPSPAFSPYQPYPQPTIYPDPVLRPMSSLSQAAQHAPPPPSSWSQAVRPQHQAAPTRPTPLGPPGQPFGIYQVQIEELARNAREIWERTLGIAGLPSSVRLKVIIHHVVLRFADKFTNEPNLALFTDALNNNSQMKPMRTLGDLSCKACTTPAASISAFQRQPAGHDQRLYMLPDLLAHFQSVHVEHGQPRVIHQTGIELPRLDWKFDMVELPEASAIRNLMYAPGIDSAKLSLIATVLPKYFPSPLPKVGSVPHAAALEAVEDQPRHLYRDQEHMRPDAFPVSPRRDVNPSTPSNTSVHRQDALEVKVDNYPEFVDSPMQDATRPEEPVGENEYDPHRPAPAYTLRRSRPESPQLRSSLLQEVLRPSGPPSDSLSHAASYPESSLRPSSNLSQAVIHRDESKVRRTPDQTYQIHPTSNFQGPRSLHSRSRLHTPMANGGSRHSEQYGPQPPAEDILNGDQVVPHLKEPMVQQSSPALESLSAAEHFLNNFDSITTDAYPDRELPTSNVPELLSSSRFESIPNDQPVAEDLHEQRSWRTGVAEGSMRSRSPRGTPLERLPASSGRRSSRSPASIHQQGAEREEEYDPRIPEPTAFRTRGRSPVLVELRRARRDDLFPDDYQYASAPPRREDLRYDGFDPRGYGSRQSVVDDLEPLPSEAAVYYRDRSPRPRPRAVFAVPSPETYRRQYSLDEPIRYATGSPPPPPQVRYVEDRRFVEARYGDPVEYVQIAPREPQPGARYYVSRPGPREVSNEYIGYEGGYRQEPGLERNGQLYRRHDPYQDPYTRPVRYQ